MASPLIPILAGFLSGAGQGLFSRGDQERRSFGGPISAPILQGRTQDRLNSAYDMLQQKMNRGVKLRSSYAQSPPTFTGGGLPMPIGLTGRDPALDDPSLLQHGGELNFMGMKNLGGQGSGQGEVEKAMAAFQLLRDNAQGHFNKKRVDLDIQKAGAGPK